MLKTNNTYITICKNVKNKTVFTIIIFNNTIIVLYMETSMCNTVCEVENLIKKIHEISDSQESKSDYKDYTVFTAIRKENDERTHTTLLYEILKPNLIPGIGDLFLRKFFEEVLKVEYTPPVKVIQEHTIPIDDKDDNFGRIDLYIETHDASYPIEIKIYARDQNRQLKRYYDFAQNQKSKAKVFYLTLNGKQPSGESLDTLEPHNVVCISFATHIHHWLKSCMSSLAEKNNMKSLLGVIDQYKNLIEKITNQKIDETLMKKIIDVISESKNNFETAAAISEVLPRVKIQMMHKFLAFINKNLEEHIDTNYKGRFIKTNHYIDDLLIEEYYTSGRETYPSLGWVIKEYKIKGHKFTLELAFEISQDCFYYGIAIGELSGQYDKLDEFSLRKLKKYLSDEFNSNDQWCDMVNTAFENECIWVWTKKLPCDTPIDFRNCNDYYRNLYDEKTYKEYMESILNEIKSNIDNILSTGLPLDISTIDID